MLRTRRTRRRGESGTVAVIMAVSAFALFGFAALAVDLGNAFARDRDSQAQADFAALAASKDLPDTAAALDTVAEYLNANQVQDDRWESCTTTASCVTTSDLTNGNVDDGEVYFTQSNSQVRVMAPQANVRFGLANIFGVDDIVVQQDASVLIGTPDGLGVMPMYVATGNLCDYGLQTLQQPPGGHTVPPSVPPLYADGDTNGNLIDDIEVYENGAPVLTLSSGATTGYIRLHGNFTNAARVGFFNDDQSAPIEQLRATWTDPVGSGTFSGNNQWITVPVPPSVTALDELWWIRVYQAGSGANADKWSARSQAQPLSVGFAPFECVSGATDGNFGTIKLPRNDSSNQQNASGWIPRNFAEGLQPPLTLNRYPNPMPGWECSSANAEAVITLSTGSSPYTLRPGTNCVDTDTGLTKGTVTPGLVTGGTSPAYEGLLVSNSSSEDPDGSGGCSRNGDTQPTTKTIGSGANQRTYSLNDDLLTCFLTDTTTELGDVARANYTGDPVFSSAIYESPRFGWVPVFGKLATSGGSAKYQIVDFRPTFITDQPMSATKANNAVNSGTENGLGWSGSDIERFKVVYLNINALPDGEAHTPIGPYLGVGPKLVRLVD